MSVRSRRPGGSGAMGGGSGDRLLSARDHECAHLLPDLRGLLRSGGGGRRRPGHGGAPGPRPPGVAWLRVRQGARARGAARRPPPARPSAQAGRRRLPADQLGPGHRRDRGTGPRARRRARPAGGCALPGQPHVLQLPARAHVVGVRRGARVAQCLRVALGRHQQQVPRVDRDVRPLARAPGARPRPCALPHVPGLQPHREPDVGAHGRRRDGCPAWGRRPRWPCRGRRPAAHRDCAQGG